MTERFAKKGVVPPQMFYRLLNTPLVSLKVSLFDHSQDVFSVPDKELGVLEKIQIWHDNTGKSPAWLLEKV